MADLPGAIVPVLTSPLGPSTSRAWAVEPSLFTLIATVPPLSTCAEDGVSLNSVSAMLIGAPCDEAPPDALDPVVVSRFSPQPAATSATADTMARAAGARIT